MSKWNDRAVWDGLIDGTACPICTRGKPLDIIAELRSGWLTMPESAPLVGYACFVLRKHVIEVHDLPEEDAIAFTFDLRQISLAVTTATGAVKMNYEIHGNTLPHLHVHFFPRHIGDAFEGGPIDPTRVVQPVYAPGQYITMRDKIVAEL